MLRSIWEDIKREYTYGNMVTRIVLVNVAVFIVISLIWVILRLSNNWADPPLYMGLRNFFALSSSPLYILTHPWTIITHMFLHEDFWHIFANMLLFYWFGRIVGDFIGNHRILPLYLLGGLVGGLVFFLYANLRFYSDPNPHYAWGASAAVMATVVAAGVISPDYIMRLILIGDVKLKYIVAVLIFIDIVGLGSNINTGGHFAHLGGVLMGWIFVWQLRQGNDLAAPVNRILFKITDFFQALSRGQIRRPGPKVVYRNPNRQGSAAQQQPPPGGPTHVEKRSHQERLDAILDKIKMSGYDSLTKEEKDFLFNASKQ